MSRHFIEKHRKGRRYTVGERYRRAGKIWEVFRYRWKKGSEDVQDEYAKFYELWMQCERIKTLIESKMHEIWQDNDAPEAEEITMTSLRFGFCI